MLQPLKESRLNTTTKRHSASDWKIGVIDDDDLFRLMIKKKAMKYNLEVTCFESIFSITYKKQIQSFDVILLDIQMEKFDGLQVAEYLSYFFSNIPVILISGHYDPPEWEKCSPSIQAFFPKKIGIEGILKETIFWLNNRDMLTH